MASALLASRNESFWGERKVYMRKNPNSNPRLKSNPSPNPNPNPNKKSHDHHTSQIQGRQADESAVVAPVVSDDSSSMNRKSISTSLNNRRESSAGGYVTFNIAAFSRRELKELKKRLISELEQVRSLNNRIELKEHQSRSGYSASQFSGGYAGREVTSSTRPPHLHLNHHHHSLDSSGADGTKEKRMPKANKYYRPSEFVMGKEKTQSDAKVSGAKRPPPLVLGRDPKRPALDPAAGKLLDGIMKRCEQILSKLMKHKHGWIFKAPVDVVGMGLHDYNQIIKYPMDLGTVKTKLSKNLYASPLDFASDVRLTFNNALVYNPKGHDVYVMAEQLLARFEEMFEPACKKLQSMQRRVFSTGEVPRNSYGGLPTAEVGAKKPDPVTIPNVPAASNPSPVHTPASTSALAPARPFSTGRSFTGKQPKPKAKDPNKREMSFDEKQKLGMSLQNLPQDKMDQVVHIIRKRNANVAQHGDEIELDIEVLDTETLWDLDRFVCNCRKMMSKIKRQSFASNNQIPAGEGSKSPVSVMRDEAPKTLPDEAAGVTVSASTSVAAKKYKKGETVEEDVDIGEEMPANNFPPVEIEKDAGGYASRSSSSSSSSSGSSSSSDSDSGSSSGSDSDADDAQSPCPESKASPRTKEE
ncbi:transcription factor GTE2-like [Telopea speciosissima]|uniref:transcription factor GTE2-like n=1 Tax=Telopea speciosissima TaxID=54955 RepID=UPI001CC67EE0|nr:transcription factor GTE2-like [Telopea speciosissima]